MEWYQKAENTAIPMVYSALRQEMIFGCQDAGKNVEDIVDGVKMEGLQSGSPEMYKTYPWNCVKNNINEKNKVINRQTIYYK